MTDAGTINVLVDARTSERFKQACMQMDATLFMGLLAIISAVLARLCDQRDVLIHTPFSGRRLSRWKNTVGYLVNTVPLGLQTRANDTFKSLLSRIRSTVLAAYAHAQYPFGMIANATPANVTPERLMQVLFTLQSVPVEAQQLGALALGLEGSAVSFGDLTGTTVEVPDGSAQADLAFFAAELPGKTLALTIRYRRDCLDDGMAKRLIRYVAQAIEAAANDAGCWLERIPLMTAEDLGQSGRVDAPRTVSSERLHELVLEQCARSPERVAVKAGDDEWTYGQLADYIEAVVNHPSFQAAVDCPMAVYADRSLESVVAMLAILASGAALLPLDPEHPRERLQMAIQDAGIGHVFTGQIRETEQLNLGIELIDIRTLMSRDHRERLRGRHSLHIHAQGAAYVMFTSGSSGRPKGVVVPHEAICNRLRWMQARYQLTAADRVLHKTPPSFDVSIWEIFWPLISGATLVLAPRGAHRDMALLEQTILRQQISVVHLVPSIARLFFDAVSGTPKDQPVRLLVCSGEELTSEIVARAQAWGVGLVSNQYGPTEAAIDVAAWDCTGPIPEKIPIGRPIENIALHILDRWLDPVPIGGIGELYIAGVGLARGYIHQPALTAGAFVPDPMSSEHGARMYRTGDLARYRSDWTIEYLGRRDNQVKLQGVRVELGEIEWACSKDPNVTAAAALVVKDRLLAFVVPRDRSAFDELNFRALLGSTLPSAMRPHRVVPLEALPLTSSGKVDRLALCAMAGNLAEERSVRLPPTTEQQTLLWEVWSQIFGHDDIGVDDSFFALGGDSILSMRMVIWIEARGYALTLDQIYRLQTIRLLSAQLQPKHSDSEDVHIEPFALLSPADRERLPAGLDDAYPMTQLQQALLFHQQTSSDYESYVTSMRVHAPFDEQLFNRAYELTATRHPMLRTSVNLDLYSQPVQLVHARANGRIAVIDISHEDDSRQNRLVGDWLDAERKVRFDWTRPPLVRITAHIRSYDEFQLSISDPFLDGWSVATLFTEVLSTYCKLRQPGEFDGRPQPIRAFYRDFVALEQKTLASAVSQEFWRGRLADARPARLACANAPGTRGGGRVRRLSNQLPEGICAGLRSVARQLGVPLKSVLVAVQARTAGLFSGLDDIVFGVVCNGRPVKKDGDRILGAHLNTLPFRINLRQRSWEDIIRDCFQFENESLPHRRYPIATLQLDHGRTGLFDTLLNFTHFHIYEDIARNTGLQIRDGYASEQTYYALTTQCHLSHTDERLIVAFDYLESLPAELVEQFASCFLAALQQIAAGDFRRRNPTLPGETLAVTQAQMLLKRPEPPEVTFLARILEYANTRPEHLAVQCDRTRLGYRELVAAAQLIQTTLMDLNVQPEDRIAIYMDRSSYSVACSLGVLLSGAAYVPLDTSQPPERIRMMLQRVCPKLVLADTQRRAALPEGLHVIEADTLLNRPHGSLLSGLAQPGFERTGESIAYVIFTSGSTGVPSGVEVPARGLQNLIDWHLQEYEITPSDRISQIASFGFDACVWETWTTLAAGATLCIVQGPQLLEPNALLNWLRQERITCAFLPTPLLEQLFTVEDLTTPLRWVWTGGDLLHPYPPRLPFRLVNHYGPAENSVVATSAALPNEPDGSLPPIGRPISNNEVVLLDVFGHPAPEYAPGEIHIQGQSLARGYLRDPVGTAMRFLPSPWTREPGARMYRTGDLAFRLSSGQLVFSGRVDAQVKVRGVRIETGEVEAVLCRYPGVHQAAVVCVPGESGRGPKLCGYWVSDGTIDRSELRNHLRRYLPEVMVPSELIELASLPLTINGKLDRAALIASTSGREEPRAVAPISDPITLEIAQIWKSVLDRPDIGATDDFFDLGGHSLLATRLISRLSRSFCFPVPVAMLFEHPVLQDFSNHLVSSCLHHAGASNLSDALDELEILSDDQVRSLLDMHSTSQPDTVH